MDQKLYSLLNAVEISEKIFVKINVEFGGRLVRDIESCASAAKILMNYVNKNFGNIGGDKKKIFTPTEAVNFVIANPTDVRDRIVYGSRDFVNNGSSVNVLLVANTPTGLYGNSSYVFNGSMMVGDPVVETFAKFYYFDTVEIKKVIEDAMSAAAVTRVDLMSGVGLMVMAHEQFCATMDSSGSTIKVRSDGTRAKRVRDSDSILYTSESTLTSHLTGFTLPGRIQKSLRVDVGIGLAIEEALISSIRLHPKTKIKGSSAENERISKQTLNTALQFAQAKLHPVQYNVLSELTNIEMEATQKANICSMVCSSLDAIQPYVNRPVLIHPALLLNNVQRFRENASILGMTIYSLDLFQGFTTAINYCLLPGFNSQNGVTQALAMTILNNVYGNLGMLTEVFQFDPKFQLSKREGMVGQLSMKTTGLVKNFSLKKGGIILANFSRGQGTETLHQNTLHNSIKVKNVKFVPYVHRINLSRGSHAGGRSARRALISACRNSDLLEQMGEEWKLKNSGTTLEFAGYLSTNGYFNDVKSQTDEQRNSVLSQWEDVTKSISRGISANYGLEDLDNF